MPKLITLDDLYAYYVSQNQSSHFSANDADGEIVVQIPGSLCFDKKDTEGLSPVFLRSCHTGINRNHSRIKQEVMENALPSFKNRPILGYIHKVDDEWQFYDHRMHIDEDKQLVYDEVALGVIPESGNPHLEWNEELNEFQVCVSGYLYDEYTKATEILARDGKEDVSVELSIREMSFDAKDKVLDIDDFYFSGVTILGVNDDGKEVEPGMRMSDISMLDEPSAESINNYSKEGGTEVEQEIVVEETTEEEVVTEVFSEETTEVSPEVEPMIEFTIKNGEDVKQFSISLKDKLTALHTLVNATYSDADNEWYDIDVREAEGYVEMYGWCMGKNYRQSYTFDGENYALVGERVEVFARYLTADEIEAVDSMRNTYDELVQFKANREAEIEHEKRMSVLAENDYSAITDTDEYRNLIENIDNYSVDEITEKADAIVGKYARQGMQFSVQMENTQPHKFVGFSVKSPKSPKSYSGLFND